MIVIKTLFRGIPCGVRVNILSHDLVLSGFKHQLCNYVHFQANSLEKVMNPLIPPELG